MYRQANIFRVFVSSTFTDMAEERDILQKKVFPFLKRYCKNQGAIFQAVDLRWGVNEESQRNQKTLDICLNEIRRCQELSPKPNFLILLGDKYGWQPIPSGIPQNEMEAILASTSRNVLLNTWYRLDNNAIPPEYVLQPRGNAFAGTDAWKPVEQDIQSALRSAIDSLAFDDAQREKYYDSATHQEILAGALHACSNPEITEDHVLAMIRETEGLPANQTAEGYVDLIDGEPDPYSKHRLTELKAGLKGKLAGNCIPYTAVWKEGKPVHADPGDFADKVLTFLRRVIDEQLRTRQVSAQTEQESLLEAILNQHTSLFCGRREILGRLENYLFHSDDHAMLAVLGPPGSGKTSILAKSIGKVLTGGRPAHVICRFLGATPGSSTGLGVFLSLNKELAGIFRKEDMDSIPTNLKECLKAFQMSIAFAAADKPLIIYIDGLELLPEDDSIQVLDALGAGLPPHVKMIVSCENGDVATRIKSLLPPENSLEIGPMDPIDGEEMLTGLLGRVRRKCSEEQCHYILDKFVKGGGLPLYLELAAVSAAGWRSYDPLPVDDPDESSRDNVVAGIVKSIFNRISTAHGEMLVDRVLGYLAGVRKGITEDELISLIWERDPWLREHYFESLPYWTRTDEMPFIIWSRLYMDLRAILSERTIDGVWVLDFVHPHIKQLARETYLSGSESGHRHLLLARAFEEECTEYHHQLIPEQPEGALLRAYGAFAYHYRMGNQPEKLKAIYANMVYWCNYVTCHPAFDLLTEIDKVPAGCVDEELRTFMHHAASTLFRHPEQAAPLLYKELENSRFKEQVEKLARRPWIKADRIPLPAETPGSAPVPEPTMSQEYSILASCVAVSSGIAFLHNATDRIEIISVNDLKPLGTINRLPYPSIPIKKLMCNGKGSLMAMVFENGSIEIFRIVFGVSGKFLTAEPLHTGECVTGKFGFVAAFSSVEAIGYQQAAGEVVVITDDHCGEVSMEAVESGGRMLAYFYQDGLRAFVWREMTGFRLEIPASGKHIMLAGKPSALCALEERMAVSLDDGQIQLFSVHDLALLHTLTNRQPFLSMCRNADGLLYMTDRSGNILSLDDQSGIREYGRYCLDMFIDYPSSIFCMGDRLFYLSNRRCVILSLAGSGMNNIIRVKGDPECPEVLRYSRTAGFELIRSGAVRQITQRVVGNQYEHEYLNVKIDWNSDGLIVYTVEKEMIAVDYKGELQTIRVDSMVVSIQFNRYLNLFFVLCSDGKLFTISEKGKFSLFTEVASSSTGNYLMEHCGQYVCVVSQNVQHAEAMQNRFTETVLSLYRPVLTRTGDGSNPVVCSTVSRQEPQISGLSYNSACNSLYLIRDGMIGRWSLENPESLNITNGPPPMDRQILQPYCGSEHGGFYVNTKNQLKYLPLLDEKNKAGLVCFRPVTFLSFQGKSGFLMENNQFIYTCSIVEV